MKARMSRQQIWSNPIISVESLRSWVQQKVDEPYSAAKIENTISALRETGRFSPVEVDVKLDYGGLPLFALAGESTAIQSKKSLTESLPPAI